MEIFKKINWGMAGVLIAAIGMAVTAIVFIVSLRADLDNHIKYTTESDRRYQDIEHSLRWYHQMKIYDKIPRMVYAGYRYSCLFD